MQKIEQNKEEQVLYHSKEILLEIDELIVDQKGIRFDIQKTINEHDIMTMEFIYERKNVDKLKRYVFDTDPVPIYLTLNRMQGKTQLSKQVFDGIISDFTIEVCDTQIVKVHITAYSKTILSDKHKRYRVFQDPNLTYKDIIDEIAKSYDGILTFYCDKFIERTKISHIYFQIHETDWAFLKRIMSDVNAYVCSNLYIFMCGYVQTQDLKTMVNYANYGWVKQDYNILYSVKGTDPYNVNDNVTVVYPDGKKFDAIVHSSHVYLEKELVVHSEVLYMGKKDGDTLDFEFIPIRNAELAGKTIDATVIEVGGKDDVATVTLDFSVGLERLAKSTSVSYEKAHETFMSYPYEDLYAGKYQFPYTTMYSQSNTGFFCTPEKGDIVTVILSINESESYVDGAVRNPGNVRASNPNVRNYTSNNNMFDVNINNEIYSLNVMDQINLISGNNTNLSTKKNLEINSGLNILINSKDITILSNSTTTIQGKKSTLLGGGILTEVNGLTLKLN